MRLTALEPQFMRYEVRIEERSYAKAVGCLDQPAHTHTDACFEKQTGPCVHLPFVDRIEDAQGIKFLCPKCFTANHGPINTHGVICWSRSRGVPDDAKPYPGRWRLVGTSYEDLSLMEEPGHTRSVQLTGEGCKWHGFVTDGEVT